MSKFSIEVDLSKCDIEGLENQSKNKAKTGLMKATMQAESLCKMGAPVLTGALQNSISGGFSGDEEGYVKGNYYWVYVNYGTSKQKANAFVDRAKQQLAAELPALLR